MTRRAAPAPAEVVTDWYPGSVNPVRPGVYQVRNDGATHWTQKLVGGSNRYWDGKNWLSEANGNPSIFGRHHTHQWRGVRRWVLQGPTDNPLTAIAGEPIVIYLEDARPRSAKWNALAKARPFRTEAAAQRFAARFSRLALTAVLP